MIINLKALIVVLAIAGAVFAIAKPICLRFMAEHDFARRRNVWFALTLAAFICPSFWLFVLIALPLVAWSGRRDSNPVALYLLLFHVISPNDALQLPVTGVNQLFEVSMYRILSFAILIPVAWRLMQSKDSKHVGGIVLMDLLVLAWVVLQLVLYMPYETITNTMRRGFLFGIDVLVLYYVVSRTCTSRKAIVDAMASFCLAGLIFAPLAMLESLKGWLLYAEIGSIWGTPLNPSYLFRGAALRAQVSAGHAIALGYLMAIAIGFWLYLRSRVQQTPLANMVTVCLCLGLLATLSRGPWVVAVVIFFAYLALGPRGVVRLFNASVIFALVAGLVLILPIRERVIALLPFVGTVDAQNITYREQLAAISWELIQRNPIFGDPFFLSHMGELRQGQGIVDLMNGYAAIALPTGLVGVSLVIGFFLVGIWNAHRIVRSLAGSNPELSMLGVNLMACMLGALTMMAVGGFGTSTEKMFYIFGGLAAGYAQLDQPSETNQAWRSPVPEEQSSRTPRRV